VIASALTVKLKSVQLGRDLRRDVYSLIGGIVDGRGRPSLHRRLGLLLGKDCQHLYTYEMFCFIGGDFCFVLER
jgi:hypothetical protein